MKTIILYESKHGSTKQCANYIKEHIPGAELQQASTFMGTLAEYDTIVLASSVYMGQMNKHIVSLLQTKEQELLESNLAIVYCAMNENERLTMEEQNIPPLLREHAKVVHAGGGYDFKDMKWWERFIVKKLAGVKESMIDIHFERLDEIIKNVNP